MSKSLYELGLEYDRSVALAKENLTQMQKERTKASSRGETHRVVILNRKIEVLYEEIRDMTLISETLKHYYDKEVKEAS